MKSIIISSIAALSLLMVSAQADGGMKCSAGKCGSAMTKTVKKKGHKKHKSSPFLIKYGLPHLTKLVKKSWDDPQLALTKEQKSKLLEVRKKTMGGVKSVKPEITKLKREIIEASRAGSSAATLKAKVEKLASLEAEATMVQLDCIASTKAILSKGQYDYLIAKQKAHHDKHKAKKQNMMKCASGKCGSK